MENKMRVERKFYMRDAVTVGKDLLGKIIVKKQPDGKFLAEE